MIHPKKEMFIFQSHQLSEQALLVSGRVYPNKNQGCSGDSWMYPYQRTMGHPYIGPIYM